MASFLSAEFFEETNARLGAVSHDRPSTPLVVVFEFTDAHNSLPHAMALEVSATTVALSPGDHLGASLIVRLAYEDARSLANGELDTVQALRDGRLKVRGDVQALLDALGWLQAARA